jgi:hypothetical protein
MDEPIDPKKETVRKKVVVEEVADAPATTEKVEPQADLKASEETPTESESTEIPKEEAAEEPQPEPEIPQKPANRISPLWLIIPVIILIAAFVGGIYVYQTGVKVSTPEEEAITEETSAPEASPEAIPSATPNLSAYMIDIQNGSGIAGEATKVKTLLEKAGFKVGTTGNAKTYDYEKTIIQTQDTVGKDFLTALTGTLGKTYELGDNETLPATSSSDVVVIVGQTKAE